MNKLHFLFLSCFIFSTSGCYFFKKQEVAYKDIIVENRATDFKVPKLIFDEIETELLKETPNLQPVYLFSPLQVILESQSVGVVKDDAVRITFPMGGGELDLKDYILGQGSFSLSFPQAQFDALPSLIGLYFLSDSPRRKIDNEEFGLGCAKFVNLKDQFKSMQKPGFLKLNTTELRHLYVVSGIFIFVFRERNQVQLSHIRVTDSRYPHFYCSALYEQAAK